MTYLKPILLSVFIFVTLNSWASNDSIFNSMVYLQQEETVFSLSETIDTIRLSKKAFTIGVILEANPESELYFFGTASTNDQQFKKAEIGFKTSDVEYFGPGRSCAMYRNKPCDFIVVNDSNDDGCCDGFHYMQYSNDNRNLDSISFENNEYELAWPIEEILYNDAMLKVEESEPNLVYLTIFIDKNRNDIIDENEIYHTILLFQ